MDIGIIVTDRPYFLFHTSEVRASGMLSSLIVGKFKSKK